MYCVTTRFRLTHIWDLLLMWLLFHQMRYDLQEAPGLLRFAFLIENPLSCLTFSIWESESAIRAFSNRKSHVRAVRVAKSRCKEIWSAYWTLDALSKLASQWSGEVAWPSMMIDPRVPYRLRPISQS